MKEFVRVDPGVHFAVAGGSGASGMSAQRGEVGNAEPGTNGRGETVRRPSAARGPAIWTGYAGAAAVMAVCTGVTALMSHRFEPSNLIMVYLLGVVFAATRWGRGPSVLAAILSVAAFDFFFVPPHFSFAVSDVQYLLTFGVMAGVALVISALIARLKDQSDIALLSERRTRALTSLSVVLFSPIPLEEMIPAVRRHVAEVLDLRAEILLLKDGALDPPGATPALTDDPKERAAARFALEHGEPAGLGTHTLSGAEALYLPLIGEKGSVGVLSVQPAIEGKKFDRDQIHQLETVAAHAAVAFERAMTASGSRG